MQSPFFCLLIDLESLLLLIKLVFLDFSSGCRANERRKTGKTLQTYAPNAKKNDDEVRHDDVQMYDAALQIITLFIIILLFRNSSRNIEGLFQCDHLPPICSIFYFE